MFGRWIAAWRARRAVAAYERGRFAEAEAGVRHALEADPRLPDAAQYLGVLALKQGRLQEAEDHLAKAAGGDPFVLNQALGAAALLRGRYEEADRRFAQALAAFPVAFEIGYHAGLIRFLQGDETGALTAFTRLLAREDDPLFKRLEHLST